MATAYRHGAIGALLDEYERAIADLRQTIADLPDAELCSLVDKETTDARRCVSIQSILSHVVSAGYAYAVYIRRLKGQDIAFPKAAVRLTASDYAEDLDGLFDFTLATFAGIQESELEEPDSDKKILTTWGQRYDIEQMMEHAIVHVLRHRRQIERFSLA